MCHIILQFNTTKKIIAWPSQRECEVTARTIQEKSGFPGVIGAVDGSHIPIKAPNEDHISYINRKNFHSLVLQGICDNKMLFIDCYAGEAGSVHDATVFRRSNIYQRVPSICFPNDTHLLGDAAYPLSKTVMVPYKNNGRLTQRHIHFNQKLSKARVVIERSFALLKGRFRRLKLLESTRLDIAVAIIMSACVFHNICILSNDNFNDIMNIHEELIEEQQMNVDQENMIGRDMEENQKRENIKDTM